MAEPPARRDSWARWAQAGVDRPWTVGVEEEVMLLDPSDWKQNSVDVRNSASELVAQSPLATWGWGNAIEPLPDNSSGVSLLLDGTDDDGGVPGDGSDEPYAAGTLLTLASSRSSPGRRITPGIWKP